MTDLNEFAGRVLGSLIAAVVKDAIKVGASAIIGLPPAELEGKMAMAVQGAIEAYEKRYGSANSTFLARQENLVAILGSLALRQPLVSKVQLAKSGFDVPDATDEEVDFFFHELRKNISADRALDDLFVQKEAYETIAELPGKIAELKALLTAAPAALFDVDRIAFMTRATVNSLSPAGLPLVERGLTRELYRQVKARFASQTENRQAIPLIGRAGEGKSTVLFSLFKLIESDPANAAGGGVRWVALLPCERLSGQGLHSSSVDWLAGEAIGSDRPLVETLSLLTASRGPGLLLIDTIDLVLDSQTLDALVTLFHSIAETGTLVVFTCRSYEFQKFLQPFASRAGGPGLLARELTVPPFSPEEVRRACEGFFQLRSGGGSDQSIVAANQAREFATRVLTLTAHSVSLAEIVFNPLLLVIVCELFGERGTVPRDMTVSRLYSVFWEERIAAVRQGDDIGVALRKTSVCLQFGAVAYLRSKDLLLESLLVDDLQLQPTTVDALALERLLSQNVLRKTTGMPRLRFFHQTFLEYTIGRWLAAEANTAERLRFLARLRERGALEHLLFAWPIVRQMLSLLDLQAFGEAVAHLDKDDPLAFRAGVHAAVTLESSDPFRELTRIALAGDAGLQWEVLSAAEGASPPFLNASWDAALAVLTRGAPHLADNAAHTLGILAAQGGSLAAQMGDDGLAVVTSVMELDRNRKRRSTRIARFVKSYCEHVPASTAVCMILSKYLSLVSPSGKELIAELHAGKNVSRDAKVRFLETARQLSDLPRTIIPIAGEMLAELMGNGRPLVPTQLLSGESMRELDSTGNDVWHSIEGYALAKLVGVDIGQITAVVEAIFAGEGPIVRRALYAAQTLSEQGQESMVASAMVSIRFVEISPDRYSALARLVRDMYGRLSEEGVDSLSIWLLGGLRDATTTTLASESLSYCAALYILGTRSAVAAAACRGLSGSTPRKFREAILKAATGGLPRDASRSLIDLLALDDIDARVTANADFRSLLYAQSGVWNAPMGGYGPASERRTRLAYAIAQRDDQIP